MGTGDGGGQQVNKGDRAGLRGNRPGKVEGGGIPHMTTTKHSANKFVMLLV